MATTTRSFVTKSKGKSDPAIAVICPRSSLNCSGRTGDICAAGIAAPDSKYNKLNKFSQSVWRDPDFKLCSK